MNSKQTLRARGWRLGRLFLAASLAMLSLGCGGFGGQNRPQLSDNVFSRGFKRLGTSSREAKLREEVEKDSFPTAAQAGLASQPSDTKQLR